MRITSSVAHALGIAPLAAPVAVWMGCLLRGLVQHPAAAGATSVVVSAIFLGGMLVIFGAPLAYAATAAIVWPLSYLLESTGRAAPWMLTIIAALAGGILFPVYLHVLEPNGTFDFFPGAGFVAGGAAGWAFWFLARGGGANRPGRSSAPGEPHPSAPGTL